MLPFTINYYVHEFIRIIYHPGTELQTQVFCLFLLIIMLYNYSTIILCPIWHGIIVGHNVVSCSSFIIIRGSFAQRAKLVSFGSTKLNCPLSGRNQEGLL